LFSHPLWTFPLEKMLVVTKIPFPIFVDQSCFVDSYNLNYKPLQI